MEPGFRDAEALRAKAEQQQAELVRGRRPAQSAEETRERIREAMAAGEWADARDHLERLVEAHPNDQNLAEQLELARTMVQVTELNQAAALLVEQGRWDEARVKMEEAKQLDSHYRPARG
jgi:tetratricopeptide (TPR) repeat protein